MSLAPACYCRRCGSSFDVAPVGQWRTFTRLRCHRCRRDWLVTPYEAATRTTWPDLADLLRRWGRGELAPLEDDELPL
jgi:transposase-like protein